VRVVDSFAYPVSSVSQSVSQSVSTSVRQSVHQSNAATALSGCVSQ